MNTVQLSLRGRRGNANHHIWENNGTYWCHFTVHLANYKKARRRFSLKTKSIEEARRRRDALIRRLGGSDLDRG